MSAQVSEYTLGGVFISAISNVVSTVTSPFSGELDGSVGALLNFGGVSASSPGTLEWAVGCFSGAGATGAQYLAARVYVTISAGGSTYTTSATPPG